MDAEKTTETAEEKLIRRLELAARAISLAYAIWMVWMLIPEHRQKMARMRVMEAIRKSAGRAASRAGAQAISLEARTGTEAYLLPYGLSVLRDKAAAAYERARYTA